MDVPNLLVTALLLLLTFLIGCAIGWFVRTRFFGASVGGNTRAPASAAAPVNPAPTAVAPVPDAVVADASDEATEQSGESATVKPAARPQAASPKPATATAKPDAAAKPKAAKKPATTRRKPATAATAKPAAVKPAKPVAEVVGEAGRPAALDAPRGGTADDLKQISGIGPKLESKLNGLGVFHFDQIAAWDAATVAWVDEHLSFKGRIQREDWIAQARQLSGK